MISYKTYNALRLFAAVAHHNSFTAAGEALNLTKGAVSYQMKQLEREVGFFLFRRNHEGITLTEKGRRLWLAAQLAFGEIEGEIVALREADPAAITIGMSTYFASRWLSPRLMHFITRYPQIRLRLQPVIGNPALGAANVDMMIRWGKGEWTDAQTELLLHCPAIATAGKTVQERITREGLAAVLPEITLLHDRQGSQAWGDWFAAAGLPYHPRQDSLVIPDPNVRVQAVIDGGGAALNDALVAAELAAGRLFQISPVALEEYGYYLSYPPGAINQPALGAFREWIFSEAE